MPWNVASIHLIGFSEAIRSTEILPLWTNVYGTSPLNFQQNPPGFPPGAQASGIISDYNVAITSQVGRIELIVQAPSSNTPEPAKLDDPKKAISILFDRIEKFVGENKYNRLAVNYNAFRIFDSGPASVKAFGEAVGIQDLPGGASDLSFSANVQTQFKQPNVTVNRLLKWEGGVAQYAQVNVSTGTPSVITAVKVNILTLLADVSTVPSPLLLSKSAAVDLYQRLVVEAEQLIEGGRERLINVA